MRKATQNQSAPALDQKEVDFFIDRLIEILLQQVEDNNENEHEEKTRRVSEAV
ncbi:MAG: hypothetical protein WAV15_00720 [Minisyncoccia bacterium]